MPEDSTHSCKHVSRSLDERDRLTASAPAEANMAYRGLNLTTLALSPASFFSFMTFSVGNVVAGLRGPGS